MTWYTIEVRDLKTGEVACVDVQAETANEARAKARMHGAWIGAAIAKPVPSGLACSQSPERNPINSDRTTWNELIQIMTIGLGVAFGLWIFALTVMVMFALIAHDRDPIEAARRARDRAISVSPLDFSRPSSR